MGDQKYELKAPAQKSADIDSKKALLLSKWQGRFKWVPKEVKVYRQILVNSVLVPYKHLIVPRVFIH